MLDRSRALKIDVEAHARAAVWREQSHPPPARSAVCTAAPARVALGAQRGSRPRLAESSPCAVCQMPEVTSDTDTAAAAELHANPIAAKRVAEDHEEDHDAVICPRHRPLTQVVARIMTIHKAMPFVLMGPGLAVVCGYLLWQITRLFSEEHESTLTQDTGPGGLISAMLLFVTAGMGLGCLFMPGLFTVLCNGGTLDLLGAGSVLISERQNNALLRWSYPLTFLAGSCVIYSIPLMINGIINGLQNNEWGSLIGGSYILTFFPCFTAWWHCLKTSSALVSDKVFDARARIEGTRPGTLAWEKEVVPCITSLVTETLPALSAGFGNGVLAIFLQFFSFSFAALCVYLMSDFESGPLVRVAENSRTPGIFPDVILWKKHHTIVQPVCSGV